MLYGIWHTTTVKTNLFPGCIVANLQERMTDIESMLLNDVPYLNVLDSSESAARSLFKKYALPDIRYIYIT